ncbi:hypothetical protein [Paucilactobacillus sp. N302-9]
MNEAIEAYKQHKLNLGNLRQLFIGSGSDSYVDLVMYEIGYDQFVFYVFAAKEGDVYNGEVYPEGYV